MPGKSRTKYNLGQTALLLCDLEVPSGGLCEVRRVGPMDLIKAGLFDKLDILGSLVQTEHVDRVEGRARPSGDDEKDQLKKIQELIRDKSKLLAAEELIDSVVVYVVTQPKILALPEPGEDRNPDSVYVDSIDWMDKMFIFQFVVGGSADLESFRQEFSKVMGSLGSGEGVPVPAK